MSKTVDPLGKVWFENQSEHALACAKYGDCIFEEVQSGAQELQKAWEINAKPWYVLMDKAVQGSMFGLFSPIMPKDWLIYTLFRPDRFWPKGLSPKEKELLELGKMVSAYYPMHEQGVTPTKRLVPSDESGAVTLLAMQNYADLVKKTIAIPMWRSYSLVSKKYGMRITPMCKSVYGEDCTPEEGIGIFQGDLERGWKMETLSWDSASYQVFPVFVRWASST